MALTLKSSAFNDKGDIPLKYTCEGQDLSPPLEWTDAPEGTKSWVLIIDDPDAPDPKAPKMTWVHWVVLNNPAATTSLAEGVKSLPAGAIEGTNDFKRTSYGGPCPPIGKHRYFHKLYALDVVLGIHKPNKAEVERMMKGHILGQSTLVGLYEKQIK